MAVKAIARGFGHQDYKRDQAKVEVTRLPMLEGDLLPVDELFSGNGGVVVKGLLKQTYKDGAENVPIIPGYYTVAYDAKRESLVHISHEEKVRLIDQTPNLCRSKRNRSTRTRRSYVCSGPLAQEKRCSPSPPPWTWSAGPTAGISPKRSVNWKSFRAKSASRSGISSRRTVSSNPCKY